jgi:hypothetical protein
MVIEILLCVFIGLGVWCCGMLIGELIKDAVKQRRIKKRLADGKKKWWLQNH